jgi:hypothetical protein
MPLQRKRQARAAQAAVSWRIRNLRVGLESRFRYLCALSRIPIGSYRSRRAKNLSLIRKGPHMISCEREIEQNRHANDEEIAEISASTVKVAISYGSKDAKSEEGGKL